MRDNHAVGQRVNYVMLHTDIHTFAYSRSLAPRSARRLPLHFGWVCAIQDLQELIDAETHASMHIALAAFYVVVEVAPKAEKHINRFGQHLRVPHM